MAFFIGLIHLAVFLFYLTLLVKMVFSWIEQYAPLWKPTGLAFAVARGANALTEPPIRALRGVFPSARLGNVAVDTATLVLFVATWILLSLTGFWAS